MNSMLEKNLSAIRASDNELYLRLSRTKPSNCYSFQQSRSGETIPAFNTPQGAQPLHSTVDPKREAERLTDSAPPDTGFFIFLGLGGGFAPCAVLEKTSAKILIIEYGIDKTAELFSAADYTRLLTDRRVSFLIDPSGGEIKKFILEKYLPALCGGIKAIPLRTRTEQDRELFENAAGFIKEAVDGVSADYSVQAHFGMRMFSNIIRNVKAAADSGNNFFTEKRPLPVREAAVAAAGPSLDSQIQQLGELKGKGVFIISCDTALPVLLQNGIEPDVIVSIDCQHISYYHFTGCSIKKIPLILDIVSPPQLSRLTQNPVFFSGGHPLARYLCAAWRPFTLLDTSGGNVTYTCLSLAENLGADRITLFGADFAYIGSQSYARGTYIYPYFLKKQNRLSPAEALFSSFLYRSPFLPPEEGINKNYRETGSLRFYRKKLEEKASFMKAEVLCAKGGGAPLNLQKARQTLSAPDLSCPEKETKSGAAFLEEYCKDIAALPGAKAFESYMERLNLKERQIFTTLLPYMAAVKKREPDLKGGNLIEETKRRCIEEIQKVLS